MCWMFPLTSNKGRGSDETVTGQKMGTTPMATTQTRTTEGKLGRTRRVRPSCSGVCLLTSQRKMWVSRISFTFPHASPQRVTLKRKCAFLFNLLPDPFCHRPPGGATAHWCQADEKENRWEPGVRKTLSSLQSLTIGQTCFHSDPYFHSN